MAAFKGDTERGRGKKKKRPQTLQSLGLGKQWLPTWLFYGVKSPGPGISEILGILHYFLIL